MPVLNRLASLRQALTLAALTFFVGCSAGQSPTGSPTALVPVSNSTSTLHGTVDSGGGRAVVCRTANGTLQSVRAMDLYESDHTSRLAPRAPLGSLEAEWKEFAMRMNLRWADLTERAAGFAQVYAIHDQFMSHVTFVSQTDAELRPIDDSKEAFTVKGCAIEQLANWQDDETILVQKELWDAMAPRDQAALIAHEFVYDAYRSMGARDSHLARRVVGLAFSTYALKTLLPKTAEFSCLGTTPPSVDNLFAPDNGRIDFALTAVGLDLNFLSYPTQILLEPLDLQISVKDVNQAIADCRKNDQISAQTEQSSKVTVLSSYFKDHLTVTVGVACGAQRKSAAQGPEVSLTLTSSSSDKAHVYSCQSVSSAK